MNIDPKIKSGALDIIRGRRAARSARLSARRAEVYARVSRIGEIDAALRSNAAEAALTALKGGRDVSLSIEELREKSLELKAEKAELLVENGFSKDYLEDIPECSVCGDTGYVGSKPCKCLLAVARDLQLEQLNSLLDVKNVDFDSFKDSYYSSEPDPSFGISPRENANNVYDFCTDYARNFGSVKGSIFLSGGTGLGKTLLSTCIARTVAVLGYSVIYITAVNAMDLFETAHFNRGDIAAENSESEIKRLYACDLLIIDDLGTEMTTAFTQSSLYTLINTRLVTGKKTIINSNLRMEDIRRRYSQQIASRLEGEYTVLYLFGKDIRLIKKENR